MKTKSILSVIASILLLMASCGNDEPSKHYSGTASFLVRIDSVSLVSTSNPLDAYTNPDYQILKHELQALAQNYNQSSFTVPFDIEGSDSASLHMSLAKDLASNQTIADRFKAISIAFKSIKLKKTANPAIYRDFDATFKLQLVCFPSKVPPLKNGASLRSEKHTCMYQR